MDVKAVVTRCALLIEVDGKILQAYLDPSESSHIIHYATALCGGKLRVGEQIESIFLSNP
jgi:hypothetical protein